MSQHLLLCQPFMVRPDDPTSIFHNQTPVPTAQPRSTSGAKGPAPSTNISGNSEGWGFLESAPGHFKVWARCDPSNTWVDPDTAEAISDTLLLADTVWTPITVLMGTPVPDEGGPRGGGDPAIDIYLVDPLDESFYAGRHHEITNGAIAVTRPAPPYPHRAASGYISLPRTAVHTIGYRSTVIHEIFHVLQFAHNWIITHDGESEYWFSEASATWAQVHFDRTITTWPPRWAGREADYDPLPRYKSFQEYPVYSTSLQTSGPRGSREQLHEYDAFIWPFFMEQQTGGPQAIANAWYAMESATTWDGALDDINIQLPFDVNFHRFAVRNLNRAFDGQNPIGTRYKDLEPLFPDGLAPMGPDGSASVYIPAIDDPPTQMTERIESLTADYKAFARAEGEQGHWEFDFSALNPNTNVDIDAVVKKNDGTWELLSSLPHTGLVTICDVSEVYLVISNHSTDRNTVVRGNFTYRALSAPCGCAQFAGVERWNNSTTYDYSVVATHDWGNGSTTHFTVHRNGSITSVLNRLDPNFYTGELGGTAGANDVNEQIWPSHTDTDSISGSGPPVNIRQGYQYSRADLSVNLEQCTYDWHYSVYIDALDNYGTPYIYSSAEMEAHDVVLPNQGLVISGSASVPVRPQDDRTNPFYWLLGLGESLWTLWSPPPSMGTASVTWNFSAVQPSPTPGP